MHETALKCQTFNGYLTPCKKFNGYLRFMTKIQWVVWYVMLYRNGSPINIYPYPSDMESTRQGSIK